MVIVFIDSHFKGTPRKFVTICDLKKLKLKLIPIDIPTYPISFLQATYNVIPTIYLLIICYKFLLMVLFFISFITTCGGLSVLKLTLQILLFGSRIAFYNIPKYLNYSGDPKTSCPNKII